MKRLQIITLLGLLLALFLFSGCITEINEADDTNINTPTNGQLLTYENGIWINKDFNILDVNIDDLNISLTQQNILSGLMVILLMLIKMMLVLKLGMLIVVMGIKLLVMLRGIHVRRKFS